MAIIRLLCGYDGYYKTTVGVTDRALGVGWGGLVLKLLLKSCGHTSGLSISMCDGHI